MSALYLSRRNVQGNELEATVTVGAGGPSTLSVPAGDYYLNATLNAESLIYQIDTALEGLFPAHNFAVTFNRLTGIVGLECTDLGVDTWTWTWPGNNVFRDLLGFTAGWADSAVGLQSGVVPAQFAIWANSGRQAHSGLRLETSGGEAVSESGVVAAIGSGTSRRLVQWEHRFEPQSYQAAPLASGVWDPIDLDPSPGTALTQWAWADFWAHHRSTVRGTPFRAYNDASDAIGNYLDEYALVGPGNTLAPDRQVEESNLYWRVPLEMRRYRVSE